MHRWHWFEGKGSVSREQTIACTGKFTKSTLRVRWEGAVGRQLGFLGCALILQSLSAETFHQPCCGPPEHHFSP